MGSSGVGEMRADLEVVAQAELHASRLCEQSTGNSEIAAGKSRTDGSGIEPNSVEYVVDFPRELEGAEFA